MDRDDPVSVLDVFSEVSVVQLESRAGILISNIRRIKNYNGHYYIIDAVSQQIFCFEEQGNFVFKITAQGSGPGEYNYITDLDVDTFNKRLIVMDPVVQRLLMFDLKGGYIETKTIDTGLVLGLNSVYSINDSVVLLTSNTYHQIVFYDLKNDKVVNTYFNYPVPGTLNAFRPGANNVYQFQDRTFVLKALSSQIYDVTDIDTTQHLTLCFGKHNNDEAQYQKLVQMINSRQMRFSFPFQGVGIGKILSHHILKISENNRFIFALLEFNNDSKHVVIDKYNNQSYSFTYFIEDISLYFSSILEDRIIAWETGIPSRWKGYDYPELNHRKFDYYNLEILSDSSRQIILNHNPMTDNPFLVVYKFKE